MGLEWVLNKTKARPGLERRFAELTAMVGQMGKDGVGPGPSTAAQLEAVSMSCFEVIGAPRIGIDEKATEFFRTQIYEPLAEEARRYTPSQQKVAWALRPYEELLEESRGQWVVFLAKERGGNAPCKPGVRAGVDFDLAEMVAHGGKDIGRGLADEAYEDHSPEGCLSYAKALGGGLGPRATIPPGRHFLASLLGGEGLRLQGEVVDFHET
jgi:hypothetical protein